MNPEDLSTARRLLTEEQTAALGVVIEGRPYVGLVPYVWIPAQGAAAIHPSALAQHSACWCAPPQGYETTCKSRV